jgi:hypothetical protein
VSKNIVLLSDGTGQSGGVGFETNIWRLYRALSTDLPHQLICYDDGVGSQRSRWSKLKGGVAAIGLDHNVRELYAYLVRHWRPGDRIYLFGFSRGAFTVRILSDLIARCGIIRVPPTVPTEERLEKLVETAYTASLKAYYHPEYARAFRAEFSRQERTTIEFIGVWDTVGAIGLPFREARFAMHNLLEYGFRGHALNDSVLAAAHAIAIDDNRETFHPVLWDERVDPDPDRITQTWFAGVHSNVGGGYPKNQLSRLPLNWMIEQVKMAELRSGLSADQCLQFEPAEVDAILRESDPHGRVYNSRSGPAAAFRFLPRDMEAFGASYTEGPVQVHPAVFDRIERNTDGYSPHNLSNRIASERVQTASTEGGFPEEWRECMKLAKSYSYLQQVVYHLFMLPVILVGLLIALMVWKGLLNGLEVVPCCSVGLEGLLGPFASLNEFLLYGAFGFAIFTASLAVSEWLQFPLRQRQIKIASQGWNSVFPQSRIDDKTLLSKTRTSRAIRLSERLQKSGLLKGYKRLVTLVIYVLIYTVGRIYQALNWLRVQRPRLKEISNPTEGLKRLEPKQDETLFFETAMYRMPTGLLLEKGGTYRISVEKASGWFDAEFPATPDGLKNEQSLPVFMKKARAFSRHPGTKLFTLLGENRHEGKPFRIGHESTHECRRDGELVLYVNDVSLWPFRDIFYLNNKGSARVLIQRI